MNLIGVVILIVLALVMFCATKKEKKVLIKKLDKKI